MAKTAEIESTIPDEKYIAGLSREECGCRSKEEYKMVHLGSRVTWPARLKTQKHEQ